MDERRIWLNEREMQRKFDDIQRSSHKCSCGHTVVITNKNGRAICSFCQNMVFKDAKTEFEYRLNEKLIKEKRKNK